MANTLPVLRAGLRAVLLDTVPPYVWPVGLLDEALLEAVAEHGYLFPQQVRHKYETVLGQQTQVPRVEPAATLIAVQWVELPVGTPLPEDPRQSTDPAGSGSLRYKQAWWHRGGAVYFHNPLSGREVGVNVLVIEHTQTWGRPGLTDEWSGSVADLPLLSLLAQRRAYTQLIALLARDLAPGAERWNLPAILGSLDAEIARAIRTRQRQAVRSRPLDI